MFALLKVGNFRGKTCTFGEIVEILANRQIICKDLKQAVAVILRYMLQGFYP